MSELTATLVIDVVSSRCGHCGKNTLAKAIRHTDVSGWERKPGGGCGARFVDAAPGHPAVTDWHLRQVRPDLPVHVRFGEDL